MTVLHGSWTQSLLMLGLLTRGARCTCRSVRDSPNNHGELAAFDLLHGKLLWRRVVRAPFVGTLTVCLCVRARVRGRTDVWPPTRARAYVYVCM